MSCVHGDTGLSQLVRTFWDRPSPLESLLVDAIHVCLIWLHAVVDNHDRHFMNTKFHLEFDLMIIQVYTAWIAKFCA
jgi:hypothetical protein